MTLFYIDLFQVKVGCNNVSIIEFSLKHSFCDLLFSMSCMMSVYFLLYLRHILVRFYSGIINYCLLPSILLPHIESVCKVEQKCIVYWCIHPSVYYICCFV